MPLLDRLAAEWPVIAQAPYSFIAAVVAVAILIWAAVRWRYGGALSSLEQRLQLKDDQIADYKAKLEGRSPDEATALINELDRRVKELDERVRVLSPHRITPIQRDKLLAVLRGRGAVRIDIAYDGSVSDARSFAAELASVFQAVGWEVRQPMVLGVQWQPPSGVAILVQNSASPEPIERLVEAALMRAEIDYDVQERKPPNAPLGEREGYVELLITARAA